MHLTTAFAFISLVSAALLMQSAVRPWAIAALVASSIRVAMAVGLVTLKLKGVSLALILGGVVTVAHTLAG